LCNTQYLYIVVSDVYLSYSTHTVHFLLSTEKWLRQPATMLRYTYIAYFYLCSMSGDDTWYFVFLEKLSYFRCKVEMIVYTSFVAVFTTEFCVM